MDWHGNYGWLELREEFRCFAAGGGGGVFNGFLLDFYGVSRFFRVK